MLLQDPNARTVEELKVTRAFKTAATTMLAEPDHLVRHANPSQTLLAPTTTVQGCRTALARSVQRALQTRYSLALAQFYMWAQTPHSVMLAVFIPTGTFTSA